MKSFEAVFFLAYRSYSAKFDCEGLDRSLISEHGVDMNVLFVKILL